METIENSAETSSGLTKKDLGEFVKDLFLEFAVPVVSVTAIGAGLGYLVGGTKGALTVS